MAAFPDVEIAYVCDPDENLVPAAPKALHTHHKTTPRVEKDLRRVLDDRDVTAVVIATPDHWHARMAIDAMDADKDVYMEKPMTRTIPEAIAVVDAAVKHNKVVTVGVQSMADPTWQAAYEYIKTGNIGHVLQGQTSYFRNSSVGQWRYYPLTKEMTPKTVD